MSKNGGNGYRYRVGFNQSLSTGVIAFEGVIQFDTLEQNMDYAGELAALIEDCEQKFAEQGYRVASDIAPKVKIPKQVDLNNV